MGSISSAIGDHATISRPKKKARVSRGGETRAFSADPQGSAPPLQDQAVPLVPIDRGESPSLGRLFVSVGVHFPSQRTVLQSGTRAGAGKLARDLPGFACVFA